MMRLGIGRHSAQLFQPSKAFRPRLASILRDQSIGRHKPRLGLFGSSQRMQVFGHFFGEELVVFLAL